MKPDLKPLKLSDNDLDDLAKITDEDILRANEAWRKFAKGPLKDLLQAEPDNQNA